MCTHDVSKALPAPSRSLPDPFPAPSGPGLSPA